MTSVPGPGGTPGRTGAAAVRGARDVGLIVLALGVVVLPALAADLISGPTPALPGFLALAALALGGGAIAVRATPPGEPRGGGEALVAVALGWLLCAALATIPFLAAAWLDPAPNETLRAFRRPAVALFEAMSGVTGTGLSVSRDPSTLPPSLQLWRSLTQWAGGIGWLLLALMLLSPGRGLPGGAEDGGAGDGPSAYARHSPQLNAERTTDALAERTGQPVAVIWAIYAGYTLVAVVAFRLAGMPPWEALNHGLTGISTGGFAVTSDSFASYDPAVLATGIAIMAVGAVSFAAHAAILALERPSSSEARQLRWLGGCLAGGSVATMLAASSTGAAPLEAAFNWVSAIATCGFLADPLEGWPAGGLLILTVGMFVGASSGSTGGGLKMRRLYTIADGLGHRIATASRSGEEDEDARRRGSHGVPAPARCRRAAVLPRGGRGAGAARRPRLRPRLRRAAGGRPARRHRGALDGGAEHRLRRARPALGGAGMVFTALMWLGRLEVLAVLVTVLAAGRLAAGPLRRAAGRTG